MAKIVQYVNPAVVIGGHNYWVEIDDNGNIVDQLHGFPFVDNKISPGSISGGLIATDKVWMDTNDAIASKVIYESNATDISMLWQVGLKCAIAINERAYSYNLLDRGDGKNSNAVFSTLADCMKLPYSDLTGFLTPNPGLFDSSLLPTWEKEYNYQLIMDNATAPPGGTGGGPGGGGGTGGGTGGGAGGSGGEDPPEEEDPNGVNFVASPASHHETRLVGVHQLDATAHVI